MPVESMAVGRNADGRLQVFACALCTSIDFTCSQVAAGSGWGSWQALPARGMTQCVVGQNTDGRMEVFMLLDDGRCLRLYQDKANGNFTGGQDIGAKYWDQVAMARNADGRLEVFAVVSGIFGLGRGNIWHFWQTAPGGGWSNSEPFGTTGITQIAVASNADGRLEVFALGGGNIWHFWQTAPGGGWSNSAQFPDPEPRPWVRLTANPTHIIRGQRVQLTWDSGNADFVRQDNTNDPNWEKRGSKWVSPEWSTEYTLIAGLGTCFARAKAEVTVEIPAPQPTAPAIKGPSKFYVWNCTPERIRVEVWLRDLTTGTNDLVGSIDPQYVGSGCGPSYSERGLEVDVPNGHICQLIIVDPQRPLPRLPRQECAPVIGDSNGPIEPITIA